MVQKTFILRKENDEYFIVDENNKNKVLKCPECILTGFDSLQGKYVNADTFINSKLVIALAGVTNHLNKVDEDAFNRNSVLKYIIPTQEILDKTPGLNKIYSVREYEKYHTIKMDRAVKNDDSSIYAYIDTMEGKIKCEFPTTDDIRLDAKRNNRSYWVDNYIITENNDTKLIKVKSELIEF